MDALGCFVYYADWQKMTRDQRWEALSGRFVEGEGLYKQVSGLIELPLNESDDRVICDMIYDRFNRGVPKEAGRSMSLGDVIVVCGAPYLCTKFGWRKLDNWTY